METGSGDVATNTRGPWWILGLVFPVRRAPGGRSLADLRQEYAGWDFVAIALATILTAPVAYGWWKLFLAVAPSVGFAFDGEVFLLRPGRLVWLLAAVLLGLMCVLPLVGAIIEHALGERRSREYNEYASLLLGCDAEAVTPWGCGAMTGLALLTVLAVADWYAVFTPNDIRIDTFFGVSERTYGYADVTEIKTAPAFLPLLRFTPVKRRLYVLRFADGFSWNTNHDPAGAGAAELRAIIDTVSARSGVPITEVDVLPRADTW